MKAAILTLFFFGGLLALAESRGPTCGNSSFLQRYVGNGGGRIVGGHEVTRCSHIPWQVRLDIGGYLCGGSILSSRHILTAAHCTYRHDPRNIRVYSGHLEYSDWAKMTRVVAKYEHPNYNHNDHDCDVAILQLEDDLYFDECTAPICLKRYPEFRNGQLCVVSGWGTTAWQGEISMTLKMVGVRIIESNNCTSYSFADKNNVVCASNPGKDSCQGDSGGPLVCMQNDGSFAQVGVVSYGNECAKDGFPGVYALAGTFYNWIVSNMRW